MSQGLKIWGASYNVRAKNLGGGAYAPPCPPASAMPANGYLTEFQSGFLKNFNLIWKIPTGEVEKTTNKYPLFHIDFLLSEFQNSSRILTESLWKSSWIRLKGFLRFFYKQ